MEQQVKEAHKDLLRNPEHYVEYYDYKAQRAREILVFMSETKIWQELFNDCNERAGVNRLHACKELQEILSERNIYYNSNFRRSLRPKMTPGIPREFEPFEINNSAK